MEIPYIRRTLPTILRLVRAPLEFRQAKAKAKGRLLVQMSDACPQNDVTSWKSRVFDRNAIPNKLLEGCCLGSGGIELYLSIG